MDLDAYRERAETFVGELNREYYRHFAGLSDDFEVEAVYARHAGLFTRDAVAALRESVHDGPAAGDQARRRRYLLDFGVEGLLGRATTAQEAELARREATLTLEVDGGRIGFRESSVEQAHEPGGDRRPGLAGARLA